MVGGEPPFLKFDEMPWRAKAFKDSIRQPQVYGHKTEQWIVGRQYGCVYKGG